MTFVRSRIKDFLWVSVFVIIIAGEYFVCFFYTATSYIAAKV